jgi:hypothetical protein
MSVENVILNISTNKGEIKWQYQTQHIRLATSTHHRSQKSQARLQKSSQTMMEQLFV